MCRAAGAGCVLLILRNTPHLPNHDSMRFVFFVPSLVFLATSAFLLGRMSISTHSVSHSPGFHLHRSASSFSRRNAEVPHEGFFQSHGSECPVARASVRKMPSAGVSKECEWMLDLDSLEGFGYSANHQDKVRTIDGPE
jgi:hypothetical protein